MLEAIISFLPSEGAGAIGALDWTPEERKRLAIQSRSYICPICGPIASLLSEPSEDEKLDDTVQDQIAQLHLDRPRVSSTASSAPHQFNDLLLSSATANMMMDNGSSVDVDAAGTADLSGGHGMEGDNQFDPDGIDAADGGDMMMDHSADIPMIPGGGDTAAGDLMDLSPLNSASTRMEGNHGRPVGSGSDHFGNNIIDEGAALHDNAVNEIVMEQSTLDLDEDAVDNFEHLQDIHETDIRSPVRRKTTTEEQTQDGGFSAVKQSSPLRKQSSQSSSQSQHQQQLPPEVVHQHQHQHHQQHPFHQLPPQQQQQFLQQQQILHEPDRLRRIEEFINTIILVTIVGILAILLRVLLRYLTNIDF
jgi:hypothetical protein